MYCCEQHGDMIYRYDRKYRDHSYIDMNQKDPYIFTYRLKNIYIYATLQT